MLEVSIDFLSLLVTLVQRSPQNVFLIGQNVVDCARVTPTDHEQQYHIFPVWALCIGRIVLLAALPLLLLPYKNNPMLFHFFNLPYKIRLCNKTGSSCQQNNPTNT